MLTLALLIGLAAAGATLITRAVVPQAWLLVKPFSCDLCMSFWSSLLVGVAVGTTSIPTVVGGVAVSVVVLKTANRLEG